MHNIETTYFYCGQYISPVVLVLHILFIRFFGQTNGRTADRWSGYYPWGHIYVTWRSKFAYFYEPVRMVREWGVGCQRINSKLLLYFLHIYLRIRFSIYFSSNFLWLKVFKERFCYKKMFLVFIKNYTCFLFWKLLIQLRKSAKISSMVGDDEARESPTSIG